jgi:hypothetical protein
MAVSKTKNGTQDKLNATIMAFSIYDVQHKRHSALKIFTIDDTWHE